MKLEFQRNFLWIGIVLYLICLSQDAFYVSGRNPDAWSNGLGLLLTGWVGHISWLANPILFLSWMFFAWEKYTVCLVTSVFALLIALAFLMTDSIVVSTRPDYELVVSYEIGYYFWLCSMLASIVVSFWGILARADV